MSTRKLTEVQLVELYASGWCSGAYNALVQFGHMDEATAAQVVAASARRVTNGSWLGQVNLNLSQAFPAMTAQENPFPSPRDEG